MPTIASKVGAFEEMIQDGQDGILCANIHEWQEKLQLLIDDKTYREEIGSNAYAITRKKITTYTGRGIAEYVISKMPKNFGFVLPTTNISGGVNVIIKHCNMLRDHGYDVFIVNEDRKSDDIINKDGRIPVVQSYDTRFEANRGINKRGYCYISDCSDDPEHTEDKRSLYAAHNFIIVSGKQTFGMFFDYPSTLTFDIGYTRMDTMKVSCENADLNLYVFEGENAYDIVKQFRKAIGRSYIPPKFAFGF